MSRPPRAAKTQALKSRFNGAIENVVASKSFKSRAVPDGPSFLDLAVETAFSPHVKVAAVRVKPRPFLNRSGFSRIVVKQTKSVINPAEDPESAASVEIEPILSPAPVQKIQEPPRRIITSSLSYLEMDDSTYAKFCALRRDMVGKIDSLQYKMDKESGKLDKYLFHTTFNETQFLTAIEADERKQREKRKGKTGGK